VGQAWRAPKKQKLSHQYINAVFEWLLDEITRIKTPKFHRVDGPMDSKAREAVESSEISISESYKRFVIQFGGADLYRKGSLYLVRVFAFPVEAVSDKGEHLLHFGRTDLSLVYFKTCEPVVSGEVPVFEWRHDLAIRKVADGFEEWLLKSCRSARKHFKKREGLSIENGPLPFDSREQEVVKARKKFRWRVVGIAENSDVLFEVTNGSGMTLPYLSIGVRGTNGQVDGGVWLPVGHIPPGETRIVAKDCYKRFISPTDLEIFNKPDPEPEDRDRYWEFKK
jgi:hypothetical protein